MQLYQFLWMAMVTLLVTPWVAAQPPDYSGYELNWSDDFNGSTLDQSRWTPVFSVTPTNNSLHAYLPDNLIVLNGHLNIVSTNQPFGQFSYRSGQVISVSQHRYGRFEVCADLPTSRGMWPAIWLLPDQPPLWPSQGEIDIMENRGNEPFTTSSAFHWGTNPPFAHQFVYAENRMIQAGNLINYHDGFHVYAAEWDPTQIRYYVDGVHYYTVRDSQVANFLSSGQTNPMRLIINTAIGGDFLPNPDGSTQWPQFFEVDFVRVYDRVGDPTLRLENGDFESQPAGLSHWSLFGSNGLNVSSNHQHFVSGNSSLKVFGQFNGAQNFSGVEQGTSVLPGDQIQVTAYSRVNSGDSLAGTSNQAFLKFDFYNTLYGAFGTSEYISSQQVLIADSGTPLNQWQKHVLTAAVPSGAIEARVAIVFRQVNNGGGAVFIDDVSFTNMSATSTIHATDLKVTAGSIGSGSVSETMASDDAWLEIVADQPQAVQPTPIQVLLQAESPHSQLSALEIRLETSCNTVGVIESIEAFNYLTNQFEAVSTHDVSLSDRIVTASLQGNLQRFVQADTNHMQLRLFWQANQPTLIFPWTIRIDEVAWVVTR